MLPQTEHKKKIKLARIHFEIVVTASPRKHYGIHHKIAEEEVGQREAAKQIFRGHWTVASCSAGERRRRHFLGNFILFLAIKKISKTD